MSEYKPGTIARVKFRSTHPDCPPGGGYAIAEKIGHPQMWRLGFSGYGEGAFTDIQPLVCLPLTREDAEILAHMGPYAGNAIPGHPIVARIVRAIREQLPEPEPPKRWTVNVYEGGPLGDDVAYLFDRGAQVGAFYRSAAKHAQAAADALNAAEEAS